MSFWIKEVIVWPTRAELPPQTIEFKRGMINIITGKSRAGKSALLWIVDFCLGSSECRIPLGTIRQYSAAFGLRFGLADREYLCIRNLDNRVYFGEGDAATPPDRPTFNMSLKVLKETLDRLFALPFVSVSEGSARPSFRDMMAFCLQPQHIVANPYNLFYRTDRIEYRERLRKLFPFALGLDTVQHMEARERLEVISQSLRELDRKLELAMEASQATIGELRGFLYRAVEFGFIPSDQIGNIIESENPEDYVAVLENMSKRWREQLPRVDEAAETEIERTLSRLLNEVDSIEAALRTMQRNRSRLDRLWSSVTEFGEHVVEGEERLATVGWFAERIDESKTCPFCGAGSSWSRDRISRLRLLAEETSRMSDSWKAVPYTLDKEKTKLDGEIRQILLRKQRLTDQIERMNEWKAERGTVAQAFRFLGYIDLYVSSFRKSSATGNLQSEISRLQEERDKITADLESNLRAAQRLQALRHVSTQIEHYARNLDLERSKSVWIDIRELTLRFGEPSDAGSPFLSDIGSGANHMGYHVSALLGLHQFFSQEAAPVPSFIIFDQPSQVFFPDEWPTEDLDPDSDYMKRRGNAVYSVRQIFSVMSHFIATTTADVQIIVLDHVGPITWNHVAHINWVHDWRDDDNLLIPASWQV